MEEEQSPRQHLGEEVGVPERLVPNNIIMGHHHPTDRIKDRVLLLLGQGLLLPDIIIRKKMIIIITTTTKPYPGREENIRLIAVNEN